MMEFVDSEGVVLSREEVRAGLAKGRVRQVLTGFEESIVDQSKAAESDLNVLVARWMRGEPVPEVKPLQFGDVSDVGSFQDMHARLIEVRAKFGQLPAWMREHFGNDAAQFADAVVDPARVEELTQLGLFAEPEVKSEAPAGEPAEPAQPAVPKAEPPAAKPPEGARQ